MALFDFKNILQTLLQEVLAAPVIDHRVAVPYLDPQGDTSFLCTRMRVDGPGLSDVHERVVKAAASHALLAMAKEDARVGHFMLAYVPGGMIADDQRENAFYHNCTLICASYEALYGLDLAQNKYDEFFDRMLRPEYRRERVGVQKLVLPSLQVASARRLLDDTILRPVGGDERARFAGAPGGYVPEGAAVLELYYIVRADGAVSDSTLPRFEGVRFACAFLGFGVPVDSAFETIEVTYRGNSGGIGATANASAGNAVHAISDNELDGLQGAVQRVKARAVQPTVALAMRRYASAVHRTSNDDALIDAWIALEALFGEGEGEMTFRISLRLAGYVGESATERGAIYRRAKLSYKIRSQVVHGVTVSVAYDERQWVIEMTRRALASIVANDEDFVANIEERMLASLF